MSGWASSPWPKEQHEYMLGLVRADHGGTLPEWVLSVDLVFLADRANHPSRKFGFPGRRELEKRWGLGERQVRKALRDPEWQSVCERFRIPLPERRLVGAEITDPGSTVSSVPVGVPRASPSPSPSVSPSATSERQESAENVPVGVPAPVPTGVPVGVHTRASFAPSPRLQEQQELSPAGAREPEAAAPPRATSDARPSPEPETSPSPPQSPPSSAAPPEPHARVVGQPPPDPRVDELREAAMYFGHRVLPAMGLKPTNGPQGHQRGEGKALWDALGAAHDEGDPGRVIDGLRCVAESQHEVAVSARRRQVPLGLLLRDSEHHARLWREFGSRPIATTGDARAGPGPGPPRRETPTSRAFADARRFFASQPPETLHALEAPEPAKPSRRLAGPS